MKKETEEKLKELLLKEILTELPQGSIWRDSYAKAIAVRILKVFSIRGKKCKEKE